MTAMMFKNCDSLHKNVIIVRVCGDIPILSQLLQNFNAQLQYTYNWHNFSQKFRHLRLLDFLNVIDLWSMGAHENFQEVDKGSCSSGKSSCSMGCNSWSSNRNCNWCSLKCNSNFNCNCNFTKLHPELQLEHSLRSVKYGPFYMLVG